MRKDEAGVEESVPRQRARQLADTTLQRLRELHAENPSVALAEAISELETWRDTWFGDEPA
jgi:hypothetical protein